jgi:hypothetical protein
MIINNKILFLHIPHTGGRFVSNNINKNQNCIHYNFQVLFKEIDIDHLNAFQNSCFLGSSRMFETFTIVRNPIDRFIGCLRNVNKLNLKAIKYMFENETNFFNTVNQLRESGTSNWFEPQINFTEYDTKIWRFEDGVEEEFRKWMMNTFNLELEKPTKDDLEMFKKKIYYNNVFDLNEEQKQYIKNYYFMDYKIFNYK